MLPSVGEYLELVHTWYPKASPNSVSLEGYYNAQVLVEGLRRAGRDLTRKGLIRAIESIRDMPLGKNTSLRFSPTDHQGMDRVYFARIHRGKLELITDWQDLTSELDLEPPTASAKNQEQ